MKSPKDPGLFPSKSPPKKMTGSPVGLWPEVPLTPTCMGTPNCCRLVRRNQPPPEPNRAETAGDAVLDGKFPEKMFSPTAGNDPLAFFEMHLFAHNKLLNDAKRRKRQLLDENSWEMGGKWWWYPLVIYGE